MNGWTLEEESILDMYDRGSRTDTLAAIEEALACLTGDTEMRRVMKQALRKLERMSDVDFLIQMMDSTPLWEEEDEEAIA